MTENDILINSPDRGSNVNLFQIEVELQNLLEDIALAEGEMTEEQELQHKELIESFNKKGSAYGAVLNKINNDIFAIDSEVLRLQKRKASIESNIKRINYVLIPAIKRWGIRKVTPSGIIKYILKFPLYTFEVSITTKTELLDIENIPNEFKRYEIQLTREQFEQLEEKGIEKVIKKVDALKTPILIKLESIKTEINELGSYMKLESDNQMSLFEQASFNDELGKKFNKLKEELDTLYNCIDEKEVETFKFK